MEESLALFHVILRAEYFRNASVILFLNKTDLFADRLVGKPLRYTYPEYQGIDFAKRTNGDKMKIILGADNDVEASKEFIKDKYLSLVPPREHQAEKNIYPHFTCSVGESFA